MYFPEFQGVEITLPGNSKGAFCIKFQGGRDSIWPGNSRSGGQQHFGLNCRGRRFYLEIPRGAFCIRFQGVQLVFFLEIPRGAFGYKIAISHCQYAVIVSSLFGSIVNVCVVAHLFYYN